MKPGMIQPLGSGSQVNISDRKSCWFFCCRLLNIRFDQKVYSTPISVWAIVSSPIPISNACAERRSSEWKKYGLNNRQLSDSTGPRLRIALLSQPVARECSTRPSQKASQLAERASEYSFPKRLFTKASSDISSCRTNPA